MITQQVIEQAARHNYFEKTGKMIAENSRPDMVIGFVSGAQWMQEQYRWMPLYEHLPADGQKILIWSAVFGGPEMRVWQENLNKVDFSGYYWLPFPTPPKQTQCP